MGCRSLAEHQAQSTDRRNSNLLHSIRLSSQHGRWDGAWGFSDWGGPWCLAHTHRVCRTAWQANSTSCQTSAEPAQSVKQTRYPSGGCLICFAIGNFGHLSAMTECRKLSMYGALCLIETHLRIGHTCWLTLTWSAIWANCCAPTARPRLTGASRRFWRQ